MRAAQAGVVESRLDAIYRSAGAGVVQVEVHRPWRPGNTTVARQCIKGNGIVWDAEGTILTVADLAQPGDTIIVSEGGTSVAARFLAQDPDLGISLIRARRALPLAPLPRAALSSTPSEAPGWILTLGRDAVESSEHLEIARVGGARRDQGPKGSERVRLAAPPSPGLAGGAVLDDEGRLVGILLGEGRESLLLGAEGGRKSIAYGMQGGGPTEAGWFLSIASIEAGIRDLIAHPETPGFLGVRVALPPTDGTVANADAASVIVAGVLPGSPAEAAGLREGDRILRLDGRPVASWSELTQAVSSLGPGHALHLDVQRKDRPFTVDVTLADRGHTLWMQKHLSRTGSREKLLRKQIEGLQTQLELLRHQILSSRSER